MRRWLAIAAFFVAYLTTAKFGLSLATVHPSATPVWPPTGLAITAALLLGRAAWPAILVGALIVNASIGTPILASIAIAIANTLEAVAGAYMLAQWAGGARMLVRSVNIFRFALFMPGAVAISATSGTVALALTGAATRAQYGSVWLTWWLGDLSGALIVVPLLLAWLKPTPAFQPTSVLERALVFVVVAIVAATIFAGVGPWPADMPLAFLTIPPVLWAAIRFGQRETTASVALVSLIATVSTVRALGPFSPAGPDASLTVVQAFVATLMTTMVPISAIVIEWRRAHSARTAMLARERKARMTAEAMTAAQEEFLAMLSHELRNPMGAIRNATHVLETAPAQSQKSRQAQEIIARQVTHLAGVITDLLDLTRVKTGKLALDRKPIALDEVVGRCVSAMRLTGEAPAGGAQVRLRTERVWVDADPTRVEQIVNNLLSNARKYTPPDGTIEVSLSAEGNVAVLRVADTGVGIAPELLPRIFDQFVQGERDSARSAGGLGLGLTLVKRFVDMHGGSVTAESEGVGRGSAFIVRLPAIPAPAATPRPPAPIGQGRRVLVVEDQEDLRQMMRIALELAGHEVFDASDGPSGVELVDRVNPDVAFVDVGLPGFDGHELARRVRATHGERVVLIALTGYGQPEDRRRAEEAGFNLHLVKPVNPLRLSELAGAAPRFGSEAELGGSAAARVTGDGI